MIREAINGIAKSSTFKYNNEEWKITLYKDRIDLEVDANGIWTSVEDILAVAKNMKQAMKIAKKTIDSFQQYK